MSDGTPITLPEDQKLRLLELGLIEETADGLARHDSPRTRAADIRPTDQRAVDSRSAAVLGEPDASSMLVRCCRRAAISMPRSEGGQSPVSIVLSENFRALFYAPFYAA